VKKSGERSPANRRARRIRGWILAVAIVIGAVIMMPNASAGLFAGASSAVVSPSVGAFIAGDARDRRFTGIHDDLYAKALVLHDGTTAMAFVVVDCIGLTYPDVQRVRAACPQSVGGVALPGEHILVCSTHTHCGPDVVGIWGADPMSSGRDEAYIARLVATAAAQVEKAGDMLRAVRGVYGETTAGEGWVVNDCEPELLDRSLSVLQFLDDSGNSVATLTNFACHPTILDAVVDEVSADYLWGFYQGMAEKLGGEHLFLQGAIGGWVQPNKQTRDYATVDQLGRGIAAKAMAALAQPTPLVGDAVRVANRVVDFPVENPGWQMLAKMGIVKREIGETVRSEVAWFSIGNAQGVTHPGETSPAHGLHAKERMRNSGPKLVIGLGLDGLGYILKPAYFDGGALPHAEYLTGMSLGRETAPVMLDALDALIPRE